MDSTILTSPGRQTAKLNRDHLLQEPKAFHLLGNDQMQTRLSVAGAGYVHLDGQAITRWRPDPTCDADGYFFYLRDLDSQAFWSATYLPTKAEPEEYEVEFSRGLARFIRRDGKIVSKLEVFLSPDANVEFRRLTVTNQGTAARRIELTSYAEIVLQAADADAVHPAFSKLFVETWCEEPSILFAKRRPRISGETTLAASHFFAGGTGSDAVSFETDRANFLGRGNTTVCPTALQVSGPLKGQLGSVLDPVFSLRRVLFLAPNESVTTTFAIAAGNDPQELLELAKRYEATQSLDAVFQTIEAISHGEANGEALHPLSETLPETLPDTSKRISTEIVNSPAKCSEPEDSAFDEPLQHDNGWGGFTADGTEYVIRLRPTDDPCRMLPPMPWVNIVSNEKAGFIVSETGAGYTWSGNSRLNRLTPWHNDPISNPHGEAIYIRDEDTQTFWSPTPGPVRQSTEYEIRHGFGYTCFRHTSNEFSHELTQFVPRDDGLKITWVRLQNTSDRTRRISLFSYHHWDLTDGNLGARTRTETTIDPRQQIIFATNDQRGIFANNCSFATLLTSNGAQGMQSTCDRLEFLGPHGDLAAPQALTSSADLSGRSGKGFDQCAASSASVEIGPGETLEFAVLLGEAPSKSAANDLIEQYRTPASWTAALDDVRAFWSETLAAVQIETPSSALNLMVNGWLTYQNLSCRMWGRSALYQSGGAFGYRDQLQDSAALLHHCPELTRKQILRNAAHQFVEGDVQHWWHPPESIGIRTQFSDDLLWLPLFAAEYVEATGDEALWQEQIPFLTGSQLPAGEAEIMLTPTESEESGSLYEHCCRALDRGLTSGRHGLPLMGCGDWNDGMNRVGQGGTGESVWLGFFIDYILGKMLPVCEQFGDNSRLQHYLGYREQLRAALHDAGWDGGWYRRAYFDDGTPLGTAAADECQIDALVQAWAVLSGADTPERANKAMEAAAARLIDEEAGLIRLLDPPFDKMKNDPGYIKGYLPGVRENGGQYTHGVLWFIRAIAELGYGTRAVELLEMLTPINHARTPEEVETYQTEPYVVAADVYGKSPHVGRGGWSWYTGSAGWMWRVAVESILGVRLVCGNTLQIDPRISAEWPECRIWYRLPDSQTQYEILINNPNGKEKGVVSAELDGRPIPVESGAARIPLVRDGKKHLVTLGL